MKQRRRYKVLGRSPLLGIRRETLTFRTALDLSARQDKCPTWKARLERALGGKVVRV